MGGCNLVTQDCDELVDGLVDELVDREPHTLLRSKGVMIQCK